MFRWGRDPEPNFNPKEYLFQRFSDDVGYEKRTTDTSIKQTVSERIRWAEQSVNRSRFGKPIDTLFPGWCDHGVFGYAAEGLPRNIIGGGRGKNQPGPIWDFEVEHNPLVENYGHSNVYARKDRSRVDRSKQSSVSALAKKTAREAIASHPSLRIFRYPTIGERFAWVRRRLGL